MHKPVTIKDFSAVVTGLLLALNLPPMTSVVDGGCRCFLCDHCCKAALRRTGTEFHEPGSWCTLLSSDLLCRKKMTNFVYDGVTGYAPLANLKAGESVDSFAMLIGNTSGTIGKLLSSH